ncbi:rhodanese-like domain-containing protein [Patescibacteria group bacterium]|nr:rhodanese-like domain-containing protein [bacterium]MBU1901943.1 rhodanese-like domain-containing protein [Patescibacteria group bacterium]
MTLTKQLLLMVAISVLLGLGARFIQKSPVPFWGFPKPVELIQPTAAIAKPDAVSPDSAFVSADKPYEVDFATTMGLFMKQKKAAVHFLDARAPELYAAGHVPGAINLPYEKIEKFKAVLDSLPKDELFVTYCEGGDCHDSHDLAELMIARGWKRMAVFVGGWEVWMEETDFVEKTE